MRFNNLQILRLFAATGVVVYHLGCYARISFGVFDGPTPWLLMPWFASVFVPLFFALSGFVLTHALQSTTPGRYVVLRAVRLYPGFWLALALLMVVYHLGLWPGPWLNVPDPAPNRRTLFLLPTGRVALGQYPLMIEWSLIYEVFLSLALLVLWMVVGPRRLPLAVLAWLAFLAAKSVVRPGYGTQMLPVWKSVWASAHLAPFLLGVLAYYLKDRGRRWRWPAFAVSVALTLLAGGWVTQAYLEPHAWVRAFASALTVWFLVQVRDAGAKNPLVVGGGYSYGLYLVHVPVMLLAMGAMKAAGVGYGTAFGVFAAGFAALAVGLAFGRLETRVYARAKKLADRASAVRFKWKWRIRTGVRVN